MERTASCTFKIEKALCGVANSILKIEKVLCSVANSIFKIEKALCYVVNFTFKIEKVLCSIVNSILKIEKTPCSRFHYKPLHRLQAPKVKNAQMENLTNCPMNMIPVTRQKGARRMP